jgi:hypothetical protein
MKLHGSGFQTSGFPFQVIIVNAGKSLTLQSLKYQDRILPTVSNPVICNEDLLKRDKDFLTEPDITGYAQGVIPDIREKNKPLYPHDYMGFTLPHVSCVTPARC